MLALQPCLAIPCHPKGMARQGCKASKASMRSKAWLAKRTCLHAHIGVAKQGQVYLSIPCQPKGLHALAKRTCEANQRFLRQVWHGFYLVRSKAWLRASHAKGKVCISKICYPIGVKHVKHGCFAWNLLAILALASQPKASNATPYYVSQRQGVTRFPSVCISKIC